MRPPFSGTAFLLLNSIVMRNHAIGHPTPARKTYCFWPMAGRSRDARSGTRREEGGGVGPARTWQDTSRLNLDKKATPNERGGGGGRGGEGGRQRRTEGREGSPRCAMREARRVSILLAHLADHTDDPDVCAWCVYIRTYIHTCRHITYMPTDKHHTYTHLHTQIACARPSPGG